METFILLAGILVCGILLAIIFLVNLVYFIQMKILDRIAESIEESIKRHENSLFEKIRRAIAGNSK